MGYVVIILHVSMLFIKHITAVMEGSIEHHFFICLFISCGLDWCSNIVIGGIW